LLVLLFILDFGQEKLKQLKHDIILAIGVTMANIKTYKRNENIKLSKNFHLSEWECKCGKCSETLVDMDHVSKLQQLREYLDSPIKITSAYRCPTHNKKIGGASNSRHMKGDATDIQVPGMNPLEVQDACESFDGLGRYDTFTHIDSRGYNARWDNRSRKEYLSSGPSDDDINITLEDIEKDLGL
jgi:uncharacterized protein YcbK (DUF882 family)